MAEAGAGFLEQLKSCIVWSWTYLWTVWFFLVLFLVYILRVPLRINDNLSTGQARPGPARPPLPRPGKLVQSRAAGSRPAGTRARGRAASGGRRCPAAFASPRGSPAEPRELSSLAGARASEFAPRRRPAPGCAARAHAWLGLRARAPPAGSGEPRPGGCRCGVDRESMSVGPSRSMDDVSGHPTECRGDARTRAGHLEFLTPLAEVSLFSAELSL